ncbi:glycoside hydrolase family 3 N-terminal domain-containing protein [Campylobacter mucosalis]|uniref:glycoside hydrolase family 3 N-terminal domain-containing protein n=1 Tax=Campylobacter mucosalis TaxID=202 RepID=UPI00146FCF97|nr:glycoside hydrolase family 3 N-terminal domain-containing protein [Campylobacter mucosalis]
MRFLIFLLICLNLNAKEPSLREQISQMIMVGVKDSGTKTLLSDAGYGRFGGVFISENSVKNKANLKSLTKSLKQKQSKILIAVAEQGGDESLLKKLGYESMSLRDVANSLDINLAKELFLKRANALKELGINVNLAPTADLYGDSFGKNSAKTSLYALVFIDSMKEAGVISAIKHFPGQCDIHSNTCLLAKETLSPFQNAINSGILAIVVGKFYVDNIDDKNPALFSNIITDKLLRDELGFNGVVFSVDFKNLNSIPLKERIVRFINAGGDVILFSDFYISDRKSAELITQHIIDAVNEKRITKDRIRASYERIMKLKGEIKD